MKSISLKLPAELAARLTKLSKQRGAAKSEFIRAALEAYFAAAPADDQPSCADLAGDLAGSLQGPRDLATNPKHLRGYGR